MDYIKFAEDMEDIILEYKNIELLPFENEGGRAVLKTNRDFYNYDYSSSYSFIIGLNEDETYNIEVIKDGFPIENPNIIGLYSNYSFSKEELICFIKEFPKLENNKSVSTSIEIDDFINIVANNKLVLKGINKNYFAYYEDGEDFIYHKSIRDIDIAYFSNGNDFYRVELYSKYYLCASGCSTNSLGYININKVDELPSDFTYNPLIENTLINHSIKGKEQDELYIYNGCIFDLIINTEKIVDGFLFCEIDCCDSWYPRGYANITLSEDDKDDFFKKGKFIVEKKEIVSIEEEESLEDENDEYFENEF